MKQPTTKTVSFLEGFPIRLPYRSDLHLMRKIWHMVMGLVIVWVYMSGISRTNGVLILGSVLGFDLILEALRLRNPAINEKMIRFWGGILRAEEMHRLSTIPQYVSASMIAVGLFPKPVAILSILYLACGDPMASFFGILYGHKGRRFANGKSLVGTLAGVTVCTLVTVIYLKSISFSDESVLFLSILGGLAGGMAEMLPFDIDDNFIIPVVSGFALWLGFLILGI